MTLTTAAKIEPQKVIKKKVYLSKNKRLLLDLLNQDKKETKKDGND
jgi:hypothetical protein